MTPKERILAALNGQPTDTLPFIPRLDIWYNANAGNGTLPAPYQHATLREMVDDLGFGYHAIIPDFKDFTDPEQGDLDVGLGIYHLKKHPYRIKLHNVKRTHERSGDGILKVKYKTPKGDITTTVVHSQDMKRNGITLYVIKEHAIKSKDDYPAMKYIFDNMEVIPDYDNYTHFQQDFIGDRGVAVALSAMWASPGHYLIKELMAFDTYYYEQYDNPDEMNEFIEQITPFCSKLFDAALNSPAEVILSGANYDTSFTAPSMFEEYIMPALKEQSDRAHARGKFLATHTDGENTGLMELYLRSGFDIADSICPAPMTKISLEDTRRMFGHTCTVWGGIPSISVLEDSMNDLTFKRFVEEKFENLGRGDHLILSVADTVPPAAKFDRILYLQKKAMEFGPVK
ncbi:uroporphyrinogen decarboxylase family protein [Blautia producta]|uniref:Uroporphyrinogen decarboxylase (URO-D) domain-containing protein n=2 Tax=Blautia producta TaxID=33035 RepID=A0A7G5MYP8_9FIRM|nr:uroporphyrinogen decarboxylase family protein [Blautia producta]QIB57476.1 hypothetical protein GXM18_23200 [Blautia producta ATCC 27340 = DSM 2950]QMW79741.1 hypothetical protein E5259_20225 [Blautia producta]